MLWQLEGTRTLGPEAARAVASAREVLFSAVSFAEIGIKVSIGKLTVPDGLRGHVVNSGMRILGLTAEHGLAVSGLPLHHRDPFDRLLIAQAAIEGLAIVTSDERIGEYDIGVIHAAL